MPIHSDDVVAIPPTCGQPRPLGELLGEGLANPIESLALEKLSVGCKRVVIIVSDDTRHDPRGAFIKAVTKRLPASAELKIAIASGTHGKSDRERLRLPPGLALVNHDGQASDFVDLGVTSRGTPIRVNRCLLEADLIIATGCIRPHYFAGYGAGVKAIFPGLGESTSIRANHLLKATPNARAGVVDNNACRLDMEEVLEMLSCPTFLLNAVHGSDGGIHHVVAGDVRLAFRAGAELCRPLFEVAVDRASNLVVSGASPTTDSLYQACKLLASVANATKPKATIVLVAECGRGVGPVDVVNEAIYKLGIAPRLNGAHVILVSSLFLDETPPLFCTLARSLDDALGALSGPRLIVPQADSVLIEQR